MKSKGKVIVLLNFNYRLNREITVAISKYKNLVEETVEERRGQVNHLAKIVKAPIVLEYFEGDLQNSQDVILSLKNTISNKKQQIDILESKIIGFNRVIASLSTSNFNMLSSKITAVEARVRHYQDLYKQEIREREQIEASFKELEVSKLRVEKDLEGSSRSYINLLKELKSVQAAKIKLEQDKVDKKVLEDFQRKITKLKTAKEQDENTIKELMKQSEGLRNKNMELVERIKKIEQEKEDALKTYLELVDNSYEHNTVANTQTNMKHSQEVEDLRKELEENQALITELQCEVSEYKEKNSNLLKKLNDTWTTHKDLVESQNQTGISGCPDISVGLLKVGQRRLFIRDISSEYPRYLPAIFDCPTDTETMSNRGSFQVLKQKLPQKVYLNTENLKPNHQKMLNSFNMMIIGEVARVEDVYSEEDRDDLGVEEGETYTL